MEKLNKYGYKKIENEKEYKEEYKKWKKKLNQITFKKLKNNPETELEKFEELMIEGAKRDLIQFEFANEKVKQLLKELTAPQRFKMDMKEKKEYLKNKIKKYFKGNKKEKFK